MMTAAPLSTPVMIALEQARFNMIEQQIRPWDVLDSTVLELLKHIKREQFVPKALSNLAFSDLELPLGQGQTMLTPKLEARLFQAAGVKASDRVLEVGTGSGYMAALLGFSVAQVTTFEQSKELAIQAKNNLHAALLDNVISMEGCGFQGGLAQAGDRGWDLIMLSGSVPSLASLPPAFLNTLAIGGRLVAVVGDAKHCPMMQAMRLVRTNDTVFATEVLFDCDAPILSDVSNLGFVF
jgi:protein-L-isoaspartate(D-aspartate) O-methyltransferase